MKRTTLLGAGLLFLFLLLLAAAAKVGFDYYKLSHINTDALYQTALEQMAARTDYRYSLSTDLKLNNYATAKTVIAGEKDSRGNLHVWGKIMDTNMEMYQFGNTCYRYQSKTKAWITVENHPLTDQPLLLMELLPETNFTELSEYSPVYAGKEVKKGKIYHIYTLNSRGEKLLASTYYENFSYKLYIEAKSKELEKAVLCATAKSNPKSTLTLKVQFTDINTSFLLEPPV